MGGHKGYEGSGGCCAGLQVNSLEDASNFVEPPADSGRDPQAARYQSVGLFKDF